MKTFTKLSIATLTLVSAATFTPDIYAADENNVVPGLTAVGAPLGLHGVDPVAFLDIGNRTEGSAAFAATHDGVAYYFSNEENKNTFEKNPERYIPQNGGFCTFGVSVGKKFDGDPQYASVVDGKLYVFLNEEIYKMYQQDQRGTIAKAEKQWKKIKHKAATAL
ncbi:YHS domain-containing (seleno)protein [Kangiella sp. TOML190]|uniref:YHS domain-containing (seleno)protein n=1 Tax=Kangiella sp. TOML190 TaxID=2931351 RepID=UPI00203A96A6|nr:YHS domain-containing (seleno)protein [Kangiella sp. TOML190]